MTVEDIKKIKYGTFHTVSWQRPMKVRAAYRGVNLVKRSVGSGLRVGCNYEALSSTKQGRADGSKPEFNAGLLGRKWVIRNVLLESERTGRQLLRLSLADVSRFKTEYLLDGKPVPKEQIEHMVLKSELIGGHTQNVFDIDITNITDIK